MVCTRSARHGDLRVRRRGVRREREHEHACGGERASLQSSVVIVVIRVQDLAARGPVSANGDEAVGGVLQVEHLAPSTHVCSTWV